MSKIMQEKFEIRPPDPDVDGENRGWVTDAEARAKKMMPGREGLPGGDPDSRFMNNGAFFNSLPSGMDIEDQEVTDQRKFNHSIAGNDPIGHNAGDVTQDVNAVSARKGFDKKRMRPTDDEYYHEHQDVFYLTVTDEDGNESFVERGNTLDRL